MVMKKSVRKNVEKTKSKVSRVFTQARESLKLLETLEKETLAKARTFVQRPLNANRKRLADYKILSSLKSMGVATRSDMVALELKVERLELELAAINTMLSQAGAKRPKLAPKPQPSAEAFPNT